MAWAEAVQRGKPLVAYTKDDLKRATGIVEGLSENRERRLEDLEDGLSIADLQAHAEQFYDDLDLLASLGFDFPAVRLGNKHVVPVALSEVTRALPSSFPGRVWRELYYRDSLKQRLSRTMRRFGDAATWLSPPEKARETFVSRASEFLASRFAGRRMLAGEPPGEPGDEPPPELTMQKFIGGPPAKVSGCLFSVHTKSPSLSAYWSGAYLISSNNFGAPTTPVKGVLQAGTYVFGVDGGAYGNVVQWDLNKVCTLPGTPSVRLQF
jgi:hypothetical protein